MNKDLLADFSVHALKDIKNGQVTEFGPAAELVKVDPLAAYQASVLKAIKGAQNGANPESKVAEALEVEDAGGFVDFAVKTQKLNKAQK